MRLFLEPAFELFEELCLHGERLLLGTAVNTEEIFLFQLKHCR